MTAQDVLTVIRSDEQAALRSLRRRPPGTDYAQTLVAVSRELYARVEKPPTRHRTFIISTRWRRRPWRAVHHRVFVKARGGMLRYKEVVPERPYVFGGAGNG